MSVFRRPRAHVRRRSRTGDEDPLVFAGSASPKLTDAICRELGVDRGRGEVLRFSEGTLFVRVLENVRGRSVYVAPDAGFAKRARRFAHRLDAPLAIADKVRKGHDETAELVEIIGEVSGRDAVVVDDFTISAGTLVEAAQELVARGARSVTAVVTHGVFAERSMERLDASSIGRLIITDSIETQPVDLSATVTVVSRA